MEYHPRFLTEWNSQAYPTGPGVTRGQILQRYRSVLNDPPPEPYLKDVVGLTIAVDAPTLERLKEVGKLFGYSARTEGTITVLEGPDVELSLIPQTSEARGIQTITMSLNRRPDKRELRFGTRSVLKFEEDGFARWSF